MGRPGTWGAFLGRLGAKENGENGVRGKAILRKMVLSSFGVENQEGFVRYQKGSGGGRGGHYMMEQADSGFRTWQVHAAPQYCRKVW